LLVFRVKNVFPVADFRNRAVVVHGDFKGVCTPADFIGPVTFGNGIDLPVKAAGHKRNENFIGLFGGDLHFDDGTVAEIGDGKDVLYPEYKQYNFLLDCDVKTEDVKSGSGDVIGQRAYISVLKSQLSDLTAENFAEFAESVVKDSGYNYFTIKCDDGTGIVFDGSDVTVPVYGTLDGDGRVADTAGFIKQGADGAYTYEQAE